MAIYRAPTKRPAPEPQSCVVKFKVTYDNGESVECEFPGVMPDAAVGLIDFCQRNRVAPKDAR